MIEWAVAQGHTVFAISYANPGEQHRDVRLRLDPERRRTLGSRHFEAALVIGRDRRAGRGGAVGEPAHADLGHRRASGVEHATDLPDGTVSAAASPGKWPSKSVR